MANKLYDLSTQNESVIVGQLDNITNILNLWRTTYELGVIISVPFASPTMAGLIAAEGVYMAAHPGFTLISRTMMFTLQYESVLTVSVL